MSGLKTNASDKLSLTTLRSLYRLRCSCLLCIKRTTCTFFKNLCLPYDLNISYVVKYDFQEVKLFCLQLVVGTSNLRHCVQAIMRCVQINQQDATLLMNDLYFSLFGSTCFGLSPVHHQEYHLIGCITHWYIRAGESSCCVDVHPRNSQTPLHEHTNTLYSL